MTLYSLLSRLPSYVRSFGAAEGLRLLLQVERKLDPHSQTKRSFQVKWAKAPIWLRDSVADHSIFWQNVVAQHYDIDQFPQARRLTATYDKLVAAGKRPIILDCGGNIGLSAIWFAHKFTKAQIFTVEPEANNFELLSENVAPYGDSITAIRGAVWPRSELLHIKNKEAGAAAYQVQPIAGHAGESIRGYTIDELLRLAANDSAFIVKLDIEGAQKNLFQQNTEWVARTNLIILELDDWQFPWAGTSRSFFSCVSQQPFEYLISGEHIFCFRDSQD
jgi:FkbM family methyltransferase